MSFPSSTPNQNCLLDHRAHCHPDCAQFRQRMRQLNEFMATRRLPKTLQLQVRRYCLHQWSRKGALEDSSIITDLPCNLRNSVTDAIYGDVLRTIGLFDGCDDGFFAALSQFLMPRIYAPNEFVMRMGEDAEELFFLHRGNVKVEIDDMVLAHLSDGSILGEVALFSDKAKRTASVRCTTWCEFFALSRANFDELCSKFPEEERRIRSVAEDRMAQDLLRRSISKNVMFADMPQTFKQELCDAFDVYHLTESDGSIFLAGDFADSFMFIASGHVEAYIRSGACKPCDTNQ
eukprot:m.215488 g.215488  ORF g.215488 m.215488 type:complete len:290 (-) comp18639_c0_seq4:117-986(-)